MKFVLALLALCAVSFAANADQHQSGGFKGPDSVRLVTAAEAAQLRDDTYVKVVGYITKSLGDEKYEFRDDSGTLIVEIDDEDWRGLEVTPDNKVELIGEIDKDWRKVELDVDRINLVQ